MPAYVGNEGEFFALERMVTGRTFDLYLHSNTDAQLLGFGEGQTLADFDLVTNVVFSTSAPNATPGTNKITLSGVDFTVPSGASEGNPATHAQVTATAGAGGASSTSGGATAGGYILVDVASGKLVVSASHQEVASSGTKKSMGEGAIFRVDPFLGAE